MEGTSPDSEPRSLRPMRGRDPHESGRVATTLELLCDLTFVVAFSFAGSGLAHAIDNGHAGAGLAAFALAMFAVLLAWVNFAWFSSGTQRTLQAWACSRRYISVSSPPVLTVPMRPRRLSKLPM